MTHSQRISRNDLARYLEGEVDDAAEVAAIELAIDNDPETYADFLVLADELASATERPAAPTDSPVLDFSGTMLADVLRVITAVRGGEWPEVGALVDEWKWRSLGGYGQATRVLQAASDAAATAPTNQPVEFLHGVLRIQDSVDAIPYGVVRVVLIDRESGRAVATFLAATPIYDDTRLRREQIVVADFLDEALDPGQVIPRVIAARDNESLALFSAVEVQTLLESKATKLDDELRGAITKLLDVLKRRAEFPQ